MEYDEEGKLSMSIDECDLFRPQGFTTVSLAHNDEIGRLCAIRKLDQSTKGRRLFYLEFYNTINAPHIVLEWTYPSRKAALETVIWLGNVVIVGCSDGSLLLVSPFSYGAKRFVICASSIVAVAAISATQIAVASESSEVKLLEFDAENEEFTTNKTIKFSSDQRIVSLAASHKLSCLAVGCLNSIILVQVPFGQQSTIRVSQTGNKPTILWSLLFVDDVLFSADSRGKIMIHNPKTCALIKIITTHQADILSLVYSDGTVFASGTDYRIQALKQVVLPNKKTEWTTSQQRIFHENDVRCMANVGEWLVSAGAEHQIFISNHTFSIYTTVAQPRCSVTSDGKLILMPYLDHIMIWKRPTSDAVVDKYGNIEIFTPENGPKLAVKLSLWRNAFLQQAIIAPDGRHCVALNNYGLTIYSLIYLEDGKIKPHIQFCLPSSEMGPITALHATNSALYFAHGDATLERVDFETLTRTVIAVRQSGTMLIKIVVDSSDQNCLALTARSELLHLDLNKTDVDEEERFDKLEILDMPTDFKLHMTKDGDPMVVLVISGENRKIVLLNLKTKEEVRTPISLKECFGHAVISSVSNVVENSILLQELHGNCCVISDLNEVQSFAYSLHKHKKRLPISQFPTESHLILDEAGKMSIVRISAQPVEPPTWVPINIRRFGRQ